MATVMVLDASVVVDLVARKDPAPIETLIFDAEAALAAPELLDVEVLQTLRRMDAGGIIPRSRQRSILDDFAQLPVTRYRHEYLRHRIWLLRRNLTAYDASYVALAQMLDGVVVTRDLKLARAPRLGVEVITP